MSDIKTWSPTAAGNSAPAPDGFPENMPPSGVNDAAREVMAAVKRWHDDAEWRDLGHAPAFATVDSFTVAGDVTAIYTPGRRIRCADDATLYGTVAGASYAAPNTTVTVALDAGSLSPALSAVAVDIWSAESERRQFGTLKTNPVQPAFFAYNSGTDASQTGDGTIASLNFDAIAFDQGGNFASNTLTAPVKGCYRLSAMVRLSQLNSMHTSGRLNIVTSKRVFPLELGNVGAVRSSGNEYGAHLSVLADMDAGDTAHVTVQVTGGSKVVAVGGGSDGQTSFHGELVA